MAAEISESAKLSVLSADEEDRPTDGIYGDVIASSGELVFSAGEEPVLQVNVFAFSRKDFGRCVEAGWHGLGAGERCPCLGQGIWIKGHVPSVPQGRHLFKIHPR